MNKRNALLPGPSRHTTRTAKRPTGREWRILAWLIRHPLIVAHPAIGVAALVAFGPATTGTVYGALAVTLVGWWRGHPASFDRYAAPVIRSLWRRWTAYRGRRWAALLEDCGLTREQRHTGESLVPRVLRVRAVTPSIDTLTVRMVRGQDIRAWQEAAGILAEALIAHRVAVTRARPGVVRIIVERELPFDRVIPAPEIPQTSAEVDLGALEIGDNEHGDPFTTSLLRGHELGVGASGSGKGSLLWAPLRAAGPCIRDGIVRIHMIDLKGGVETEQGAPLFHRYATDGPAALAVITEFRDRMRARQEWMRANQIRKCAASQDVPVELLVIDEMAMLTAYGDPKLAREADRLLSEVLTQGRASLFLVRGYLQEPTKDVIGMRELFTRRLCLGVTAASHVDMTLGDGARDRGALADEIPLDERHAGIGFVIEAGSRLPIRFRAAYVSDDDIAELVTRCAPHDAEVIDLHPDSGEQHGDDDDAATDDRDDWDDRDAAGRWA